MGNEKILAIPGPSSMPVLGWRGNRFRFALNRIKSVTQLYQEYGHIVAMVSGDSRRVFAFGPTYNHQILTQPDLFHNTSFIKTPPNSALGRLSSGLIAINGEHHRQQRRLMMPAFHKNHVASYRETMVDLTRVMLDRWKDQSSISLVSEMQQLTVAITNATLFGLDDPYATTGIGQRLQRWLAHLTSPWAIIFPINRPGTPYYRMLKETEAIEQSLINLIQQKQRSTQEQYDVLTMLLQSRDEDGSSLDPAELVGNIATLFLASYDTTSSALVWTILLLTQHPTILSQLRDELTSTLHGDAPTIEQLSQLSLLDSVIKESLRLLPPLVYSHRMCTAPVSIGPYDLPTGSVVTFSPYITHRLPDLYDDATSFKPQRWETIAPTIYEYLPFGAGPRMCIGSMFATVQLKIIIALLVQRYAFTIMPGTKVDHRVLITLSPQKDIPMKITEPHRNIEMSSVQGTIREIVQFPK